MRIYLFILLLLPFMLVSAQVDTEFWFVIPEATSGHGDEPLLVRISTLEDGAQVTLSQPANEDFEAVNIFLPPNSTETIDLTDRKNMVENRPAGTILNKGLLIESSARITAYYELGSHGGNPEIFTLKGINALGKEFYVPSQNLYHNAEGKEAFDIVATEDNTTIAITPTADISGYPAGQTFTIVLDRGESWSAEALSPEGGTSLSGSKVTADKPIAIMISDDSLSTMIRGWDIIGDQLVPVSQLGNEYVMIRSYDNGSDDVFILAVSDNTNIFLDGNITPGATLNRGESIHFELTNNTLLISSDHPVYAYHVIGQSIGELGSAVIPKLRCTGSRQTGFVRVPDVTLTMLLITTSGNQDKFVLNGTSAVITASDFELVPGTSGEYVYMKRFMSLAEVPEDEASLLSNTGGHFQLGIIMGLEDEAGWANAAYGYFSDFSSLNLGNDMVLCPGDTIILDAGEEMTSWQWNTGAQTSSIVVSDSGTYWVEANFGATCTLHDTIRISYFPVSVVDLGSDTTVCQGDPLVLDAGAGYSDWLWQNGLHNQTYNVSLSGQYWVQATDQNSCKVSDTINVEIVEFQGLNLGNDTAFCEGGSVILDPGQEYDSYLWSTGDTLSTLMVNDTGTYSLISVYREVCEGYDEVHVSEYQKAEVTIGPDTTVCESDQYTIDAGGVFQEYFWSTGAYEQSISVTGSATYWVLITDANNCQATDSADIIVNPDPKPDLGEDRYFNDSVILLDAGQGMAGYFWQDSSISQTFTAMSPGLYFVLVTDVNGCTAMDELNLWAIDDLKVPNAFTPNGDGINDQFKPAFISNTISDFLLLIYNRWGEKIFETTNPNAGWDGEYKGANCPEGTYIWLIEYNLSEATTSQGEIVEKGVVTLLR